ncbi:hypothetical protein [Colwellia sp. M166]|uniref:hypothetical protein n=1 Tax=Colwellia sp. M166 TaxID=2583805 RepID=UPI00211E5861|nr:hypothetical protein [Colwellia sp. M166]
MNRYTLITPKIYTIEELTDLFDNNDTFSFNRVDNIVIQFGTTFQHLGRICYTDFKTTNKDNRTLKVNLRSIDITSTSFATKLITYVADLLLDGKRPRTLSGFTSYMISLFKRIHTDGVKLQFNKFSIQSFIHHYTDHLLHEIKIYDRDLKLGLSTHTAQTYQSRVISFFAYAISVEESELTGGLFIIQRNNNQVQSALALNDEAFAKQFSLYTQIFRQFSNIVLDHIEIPTSVDVNNELLWIAPSYNQWLKPKHKKTIGMRAFNYDTGDFYSVEELELFAHNKGKKRYQLGQHVSQAEDANVKVNLEYSKLRLLLAAWACRAYFMHFLIVTGENDSTAASLIFEDEYLTDKSEQNFKSIKWRANGITVSYDIQNEFVADFQRYIQLRSYLIEYYQQDYKALFISAAVSKLSSLSTKGDVSCSFRKLFSTQFTGAPLTGTSKSFRVSKSLWVRNNYGSGISSYVMQHNKKSADSHYTNKDTEKSAEQITDYFAELDKQLLKEPVISVPIPSGNCSEESKPEPLNSLPSNSPITVSCGNHEGCLFCNKYRVHADEADIRKLLSVKYLIIQSQTSSASQEHFDSVYKQILTRIEDLLGFIGDKKPDCLTIIKNVRKEVFEQELLSEYWYRKLELLEELGLL